MSYLTSLSFFRWMFAIGVALTAIGFALACLDGGSRLAWSLMTGGSVVWAVFGNIWYMVRFAPTTETGSND